MNKIISNNADYKNHVPGDDDVTIYRGAYLDKETVDLMISSIGNSTIKFSGFEIYHITKIYAYDKIDRPNAEMMKQKVFLDVYLKKQEHLPMGINLAQELSSDFHQEWILPHGIELRVEGYYKEKKKSGG